MVQARLAPSRALGAAFPPKQHATAVSESYERPPLLRAAPLDKPSGALLPSRGALEYPLILIDHFWF
jgi:hypothetical protein